MLKVILKLKYEAAIFDLDGTLIDSTWVWHEIYKKFSEDFKIENNFNLEKIMHLPPTECCEKLKSIYNLKPSVDELKYMFYEIAYKLYSEKVELKPGVFELLNLLKNDGVVMCLATSNHAKISELILKKYELFDFFSSFKYSDELKVNKQTAIIYLKSAEEIGVSPNNCVVFEDISEPFDDIKLHGMGFFGVNDRLQSLEVSKFLKFNSDCFIENYFDFIKNNYSNFFNVRV